jgi:hypothetical protein
LNPWEKLVQLIWIQESKNDPLKKEKKVKFHVFKGTFSHVIKSQIHLVRQSLEDVLSRREDWMLVQRPKKKYIAHIGYQYLLKSRSFFFLFLFNFWPSKTSF